MNTVRSLLKPWLGEQSRRVAGARMTQWNQRERSSGGPEVSTMTYDGPIDAVITWVDDNDPNWQRDRADRIQQNLVHTSEARLTSRFRDHDELRFLLRALNENLPWVREFIVVTAGQRPSWARNESPIRFVDHKELFASPGDLPTFNSHAIESQLWRIEGLSERWIYFNDDVIPIRSMGPERFFDVDGRPVVQLGSSVRQNDLQSTDWALVGVERIIQDRFAVGTDRKIAHVPHAQSQSIWRTLDAEVGPTLAEAASTPFRSRDDIAPIALHHWWGISSGEATQGDFRPQYVEVTDFGARRTVVNALRDPQVDVLCVNQEGRATTRMLDRRAHNAVAALNLGFPKPSPFEADTTS